MKAKIKFTKLWSILLALAMVVGMLPTMVLAAGSESADFVSDPTTALALLNDAKTGTTDSTWDNYTNTLTLNGVNFETTAATAVKLPDGAIIVLNGVNIIKGGSGSKWRYGIEGEGSITVQGYGTLNVTGGEAVGESYSYGIAAWGNLTITGGTVTATGGNATDGNSASYGIYVPDGGANVNISGGIVTATGGKVANGNDSYGIYGLYRKVNITGGALIAKTSSVGNSNYAAALNLKYNTLEPPTAYWWRTSPSGAYNVYPNTEYSWGDHKTDKHVEIWNWDPTATADFTDDTTAALALLKAAKTGRAADSTWDPDSKTLTLNGVHFVTSAATAVKLPAGATIVLNGTNTITSTYSGSNRDSHGIYDEGGLIIQGTGQLTVTGGNATGEYSYGIYAYENVEISGGTVTATGGTANGEYGESYGIYAYEDMEISGGAVIAEAGSVGDGGTAAALNKAPTLTVTAYSWRTSDSGDYYDPDYNWDESHTYVEIKSNPTVTFDVNGANASVAPASGTTNAAGKLTSLPTPIRSGYTFKGWNTKQNGTGTTVTDETTFTENTTVYAQWEVATVTIPSAAITGIDAPVSNTALDSAAVCESTGVSNTAPTVTWDTTDSKAGYGKIYTASITLSASEGYKFADSVTATVNGNPATSVTKNADGTLTVTYTFPATDKHNIEITVDTDVRDGDAAKNPTISSGYEIEYCFFVEDTDKDGVFINKTGDSITFDDKTLVVDKALVEAFAAQSGGRFTYESIMAALKDEFDLDELKTEFTGGYDYSVLAYIRHSDDAYFDPDENQIVTNAIVKVNGKKITDNCLGYGGGMDILPGAYVFSAAKTYTVSFDANGGKGTMADVTGISGEYTLPSNGFTAPDGKQFKAWSVDGKEKAVGDKITVTADTTVKAVWENIPVTTYTVSFDANGGKGTMADVTGISGEYTLPSNGFTAPEGKQFKAWSVDGTEKAVGDNITVTADTTVKAVWETLPAASADYDILNGANSKWTQDSDGNISVRGSGEFSKFVGIKVDGKTVDEKYYTVKEGSTIVTLKPEYLNTLTAGKHTLEIVWTDGTADTTFTVDAKSANTDTKSPQTGDSSSIALWIALLLVSSAGVLSTAVLGKKKKRSAK